MPIHALYKRILTKANASPYWYMVSEEEGTLYALKYADVTIHKHPPPNALRAEDE